MKENLCRSERINMKHTYKKALLLLLSFFVLGVFGCETTPKEKYTLIYEALNNGTILCSIPSGTLLNKGTTVTLTATPGNDSQFARWSEEGSSLGISINLVLTMDKNYDILAEFVSYRATVDELLEKTTSQQVKMDFYVVAAFSSSLLLTDLVSERCIYLETSKALLYSKGQQISVDGVLVPSANNRIVNATITLVRTSTYYQKGATLLNVDSVNGGYYVTSGILTGNKTLDSGLVLSNLGDVSSMVGKYVEVHGFLHDGTLEVVLITERNSSVKEIKDASGSSIVRGTVIAANKNGVLIEDDTARLYCNGVNHPIGSYIEVSGVISSGAYPSLEAGNSTVLATVDYQAESFDQSKLNETINTAIYGSYLEIEGSLTKNSTYFNITSATKVVSLVNSKDDYSSLVSLQCTIKGYIIGVSGNYLQVIGYVDTIASGETEISILEMNDLHGYLYNGSTTVANLATKIKQVQSNREALIIGNGDMFQGTALSNLTYGLSVIKILNSLDFDCMGIGNHEFDWGIDKVLRFFDGDQENGEADFPLINSNIYVNETNQLLSIIDGMIYEWIIVDKVTSSGTIKIGVVSYIGNVYSSILYPMVEPFRFDQNITKSLERLGVILKSNGADIVVVNVHDGSTSGVASFDVNKAIAAVKVNGSYLVDAILNGHTHSRQTGEVTRTGGRSVPVIQAGANGLYVGEIRLGFDFLTKTITSTASETFSALNFSADAETKDLLDSEYNKLKDILEEEYCPASRTISDAYDFATWLGGLMKAATNATAGIGNYGGIRLTKDISNGQMFDYQLLYEIVPFDNEIYLVSVKGSDLTTWENNSSYYCVSSNHNATDYYWVAVLDYVYYKDTFPKGTFYKTGLYLRDLMRADLMLRSSFDPSYPTPLIGTQFVPTGNLEERRIDG